MTKLLDDVSERAGTLSFLSDGGEMGRHIREYDWGSNPLGEPQSWPQGLRTVVRIMLTTNHPMFVFWGPRHVCLYNDAFSLSIGPEKHPAMLGAFGRDMWDEIWEIIGPQIDKVMSGRGATWHEDQLVPIIRHGGLREVYWTYSYSPIEDDATEAGVGGVLVVCTETTGKVLAERRLRESNLALDQANARLVAEDARLNDLFKQAPSIMAVLRGPGHVFELQNLAALQLFCHREMIGRTIRDALPDLEGQNVFELLDGVYSTGEAFVGRAVPLRLQSAPGAKLEHRLVDLVYQPITDADGAVNGIFVNGFDVTESKRLETLNAAQKRVFELTVRDAPLSQILDTLVQTVEAQSQTGMLGSILLLDADGVHLRHGAAPSLPEPYNAAIDGIEIGPNVGSCGTAAFRKQPVYVSDIDTDPLWVDFRELALAHGLRACWSTPILSARGEALGTFAMYYPDPGKPAAADLNLVETVIRSAELVIEGKRMEEALLRADARARELAAIVSSSSDAIVSKTLDGTITSWNASAERLFGYTAEEMLGQSILRLIPPERHGEEQDILARIAAGKIVQAFETTRTRKGGQPIEVSITVSPVHDGEGQIRGASKIARDITERKRAEAVLRASEARFRTLADAMPQLVWTARPDGFIHWYNGGWYRYTGTTPEEMEGWGWRSVHDPETLPAVMDRWQGAIATGEPFEMTFPLRGADGVFRPFLTRVMAQKDDQGRVLQWYGTNTDVEELRRAEERQGLLLTEMDHRVQNLFAVVGGIVALSARSATTPKALAETIQGRLGALAGAHQLVRPHQVGSARGTRETTLEDLVRTVLSPYIDPAQSGHASLVAIRGPRVVIAGDAVTSFALIFHELATNAAKYGALSAVGGRVTITWSVGEGGLEITWRERGGPAVKAAPERQGFGSLLARQSVRGQLGGQIAYDWDPEGLVVRLSASPERLGFESLRQMRDFPVSKSAQLATLIAEQEPDWPPAEGAA